MRSEANEPIEAGWVDTPRGASFVAYHPPSPGAPRRSQALLICDPLGPDRMNLHATHRALAMHLASLGFAVLRFDPVGTGDSSGAPRDPRWLESWPGEAESMGLWLRARSGSPRLAVFGSRVGGTLAACLPEADAVVAWGAYETGGDFLRSERAFSRLHTPPGAGAVGDDPAPLAPGDLAYLGFLYPEAAVRALRRLDPSKVARGRRQRALMIGWDASPSDGPLGVYWRSLGLDVKAETPQGYVSNDSLVTGCVPDALLERVGSWLIEGESFDGSADAEDAEVAEPAPIRSETLVVRAAEGTPPVLEATVEFGEDRKLFGIVTRPDRSRAGGPSGLGLVLVNGGHNHRVGINRNYTEWAREAAIAGHTVLRMDIRGLGDSPAERPEDVNVLYRDESQADVKEAVDWMIRQGGIERVALGGLCAGAYQALHSAVSDPRVSDLLLVDILRWDPDAPTEITQGVWARRKRRAARISERLSYYLLRRRNALAAGLLALAERGTDVLVISCRTSGGEALVREALAHDRRRLLASGRITLEAVGDTDHLFSPLPAQAALARRVAAFLVAASSRGASPNE